MIFNENKEKEIKKAQKEKLISLGLLVIFSLIMLWLN